MYSSFSETISLSKQSAPSCDERAIRCFDIIGTGTTCSYPSFVGDDTPLGLRLELELELGDVACARLLCRSKLPTRSPAGPASSLSNSPYFARFHLESLESSSKISTSPEEEMAPTAAAPATATVSTTATPVLRRMSTVDLLIA